MIRIIRDGETGFVSENEQDLISALARVGEINRMACREYVESRFGHVQMADGYEALAQAMVSV